jgi:pantetheine-phosphate adenylyltransferase
VKSVLCPGTFDPITLGHENIIRRAAKLFDCVYVAVLENIDKRTVFSAEERIAFAEEIFKDEPNIKIVKMSGLLVNIAKELGVCAILKGVRDASDFSYEQKLFMINDSLLPGIETLILPSFGDQTFISSTAVRDIGKYGGDLSKYVNEKIIDTVSKRLKG